MNTQPSTFSQAAQAAVISYYRGARPYQVLTQKSTTQKESTMLPAEACLALQSWASKPQELTNERNQNFQWNIVGIKALQRDIKPIISEHLLEATTLAKRSHTNV
jgi:hypothetical protein